MAYKALYLTALFPGPASDSSAFTVQRIKALQKAGVDVVVACPVNKTPPHDVYPSIKRSLEFIRIQSSIPDWARLHDIEVHYFKRFQLPQPIFGWFSYLVSYWQMAGALKQLISEVKPDAIISSWLPSAIVACKLGEHFRIPTVVIAEGSDVNIYPSKYWGWSPARGILNRAAALVFVSNALKDQAIQIGLSAKTMLVIHNGVDAETFLLKNAKLPTNVQKILVVSHLYPIKGVQFLPSALSTLVEKSKVPVQLIIIGEGSLKGQLLEAFRKLGLDNMVSFVNPMPQNELVKYYQQADVLCVPSLQESFGCVVIEAMACGTPVVASCVGGIPEIVDVNSGILVPPGEPNALAEALLQAMDRKWRPGLIRERVLDYFTWRRAGNALFELVHELVGKSVLVTDKR